MDVSREWWEAFAAMSHVVWREDFLSGPKQWALFKSK